MADQKASKGEVNEVRHEEGLIEVSRTVMRKTSTDKPIKIRVRPFVTDVARVECEMGTWFPTGDMAGAKVTVRVSMPCYVEEMVSVFNQCRDLADELLDKECARISGED